MAGSRLKRVRPKGSGDRLTFVRSVELGGYVKGVQENPQNDSLAGIAILMRKASRSLSALYD